MNPMIFVSAVSAEFAQSRQLVVNVLTRLGYTPVFQEIFGTESGDLRDVLRRKVDRCEGLIQIVGDGYGAEPPTADAEFGRVSYTQFEFLYATKKGLKTWVVEVGDGFPRDRPADQLDLPPAGSPADPKEYQQERQEFQKAYRATLKVGGHLRHKAADRTDLQLRMEQLRDELSELRAEFEKWKASLAGDVQNVPEAVARRLNPWGWVKRHKWAVGGVLALLAVTVAVGLLWQGANQRAVAEVAAAAEDANRSWDQVKGTDRGQTVGEKLDAAEAKLRSAGERSARGDHAGAIAEYREARDLARTLIETDLLRRQAAAARSASETTQKQVGNTFGATAAGEAARLFDAGDFPAATAKWDAARKAGEVGQVRKQLDEQLARYDVKRLEPLTPDLWKAFREVEAAATASVESGDSPHVQAKFAEAKKALDVATEPARCREAFAIGYAGIMLLMHDYDRLRAKAGGQLGILDDSPLAHFRREVTDTGARLLGLPRDTPGEITRPSELTAGGVKRKDDLLLRLIDDVTAANGARVGMWFKFGRAVGYMGKVLEQRVRGQTLRVPDWEVAIRDVYFARATAYQAVAPQAVRTALDEVLALHRTDRDEGEWAKEGYDKVAGVVRLMTHDADAAVRVIATDHPHMPTGDEWLMVRLGGTIDRSQPGRVVVKLDYSWVEDQHMAEVAGIAGLTTLDLSKTKVGNAGLAKLEKCDRLRVLSVMDTRVGPGAGKSLQKLTGLEVLRVYKNQLPAAEQDELKKALPKLKIDP